MTTAYSLNIGNLGNFGSSKVRSAPKVDVSWEELESQTEPELVLDDFTLLRGPPSALALSRRFGENAEPALKLYRDSASWCPYCQKVWPLLEEKRVSYDIQKIPMACYGSKPAEFLRDQPSGTLPAAVLNGRVLGSSDGIIAQVLDLPDGPGAVCDIDARDDPRCRMLLDLERQHFSAWLRWLTGGETNKQIFVRTLDAVENALAQSKDGPFFLGNRFSFIDLMYAPFLERMAASLAYFKGFIVKGPTPYLSTLSQMDTNLHAYQRYPHLNKWFLAMEQRPSYVATLSDFYTHAHDLPVQLGGCVRLESQQADAIRADIDKNAWRHGILPKYEPLTPTHIHGTLPRLEAAARLARNGPAVARFAARGISMPGFPPVRAELADPNANANESILPTIDALLRLIVIRLRTDAPPDKKDTIISEWLATSAQAKERTAAQDAVKCLSYLRDRVGVPRDMSQPAAFALRAECNSIIDLISS
eukprot:CAMPEP_0197322712 /NCGR_PEP_ID=MMETSP0891-20130614/70063_1 /TAXON_ID=44058 ORGANISM="Aureoumbra lagunensis, Strain CCMP1510" /NCGR_SAMPLE_ID=MMETSP0891 /ASSEMBLY_ACC=CAM_ASM_000534 /LENGTH=475 /DNA_ID=CAMNT_0042815169 /DNA_START=1040 /DNA_END=2470 /DNA_ORIENTATION=+